MPAPTNALLEEPTYPAHDHRQAREEWDRQAEGWRQLNELVGNPAFNPLTIKAFYVLGVIYQVFRCVTLLVAPGERVSTTSIPAYGVLASGIEILGRCITGNSSATRPENDLRAGLWWLGTNSHENVNGNHILIRTTRPYTITELVALRHFAAHGQATMNQLVEFDHGIFGAMTCTGNHLIANGLEHYWAGVRTSEEICNRLARANIMPFRDTPLVTALRRFSSGQSVTEVFSEFDWHA